MSKTSEVKDIFSDLDDTIRDIDPVIADKVKNAGSQVLQIIYLLEMKLASLSYMTLWVNKAEDDVFVSKIKEIFSIEEVINNANN